MLNPATLLPLHDEGDGQSPGHDCEQEVKIFYTPPNPVLDDPIQNADMTLYVDGSRLQKPEGGFAAGFAVAVDTSVLYSETLDPGIHSAHSAELLALIKACEMAEGKTVNIYTDSRYAYGVVHDFGFLWEHRGFLTSSGKVVKHADLIQDLLEKVKLPKTIAVIKCQAHQRTNDPITMGNNRAGKAAKQAALLLLQESSKENVTMETLMTLQNQVGPQTLSNWRDAGCKQINNAWKHEDGRLCHLHLCILFWQICPISLPIFPKEE